MDKINENQHNRVTFLSNVTQNNIMNILSEKVRSFILKEVKQANEFAVIIDTTTDTSNIEQYTFILRYISERGKVNERLVALETAQILLVLVCSIFFVKLLINTKLVGVHN